MVNLSTRKDLASKFHGSPPVKCYIAGGTTGAASIGAAGAASIGAAGTASIGAASIGAAGRGSIPGITGGVAGSGTTIPSIPGAGSGAACGRIVVVVVVVVVSGGNSVATGLSTVATKRLRFGEYISE